MDFDEYQRMALTTAMYPNRGDNLAYPSLGLAGESGEICEKIGGKAEPGWSDRDRKALAKELGDVLWYVALVADEIGESLNQVALIHCKDCRIDAYQAETLAACGRIGLANPALGLAGQSGKVCDKVKKMFRDDGSVLTDLRRMGILTELGSVLRYVSAVATELGESLGKIAEMNAEKLASRKRRGTITGDGDDR